MNCTECGKSLNLEKDRVVLKLSSAGLGVIYDGEGCCYDCYDKIIKRAHHDYEDDVRGETNNETREQKLKK